MSSSEHRTPVIAARLATVRERIKAAAERVGRDPASIAVIAVSKRKPAEDIVAAYEAGQRDFGENYVQEFAAKHELLPPLDDARFHFIGKLQSNKAGKAAALFSTIHTLDSSKLARRLDRFGKPLEVFLEVKLSAEESKSGMDPGLLEAVLADVAAASNLRLSGLMTMPPWNADPERARPYFRQLRELAERHGIGGLSMGMSHDLEVAIDEGATHLRIGTAIFGPRDPLPG
ncbi:MAG: YggS family pyridoxal phosphate-dependent enzyme [Bryobacterales bacterium]|nr:YggS family pyridoxal phosphate-dependent enzyme [Bryobacterales bacterium]